MSNQIKLLALDQKVKTKIIIFWIFYCPMSNTNKTHTNPPKMTKSNQKWTLLDFQKRHLLHYQNKSSDLIGRTLEPKYQNQ